MDIFVILIFVVFRSLSQWNIITLAADCQEQYCSWKPIIYYKFKINFSVREFIKSHIQDNKCTSTSYIFKLKGKEKLKWVYFEEYERERTQNLILLSLSMRIRNNIAKINWIIWDFPVIEYQILWLHSV